MDRFKQNRDFMKSKFNEELVSDQQKQLSQPPLQKDYVNDSDVIDLPQVKKDFAVKDNVYNCIMDRKSHREYKKEALTLEELSYLLWTTQGVKDIRGNNYATIRPVPSAGARHPFETYIAVNNVEQLKKGIYRYLALEHKLLFLYEEEDLETKLSDGTLGQKFVGTAPATFIWSCIPYRGEWRYDRFSHKVMLLDAGHVCQALYIACESLNLATCAIAAYDQTLIDNMIKVDGNEEFVVYMAPVGKI